MRALSVFALILVCLSAVCGPAQERISMDSARHVVELGQVEGHEGAVYSLAWSAGRNAARERKETGRDAYGQLPDSRLGVR